MQNAHRSYLLEFPNCGVLICLLLFARSRPLEDVAWLMFPKLQELNRLTWVVGAPAEDGRAEVLRSSRSASRCGGCARQRSTGRWAR